MKISVTGNMNMDENTMIQIMLIKEYIENVILEHRSGISNINKSQSMINTLPIKIVTMDSLFVLVYCG